MQQLARRAQQTVQSLSERGVPALLLKGAAVGALRDPTFRDRPMTDVDLLVQDGDTERAVDAILAAGWKLTENPVYLEMLQDAHHLPHFVDAALPDTRLELHRELMPEDQPFAFDKALFWRDARPAPAPFSGALVPSPEHLMLHAVVHFAWQHTLTFGAWRTFRTVHLVSTLPGFTWGRFTTEARAVKAGSCAYWTLRLARAMAGIAVPDDVLGALAPPTPEPIRAALERHFIALNAPGESPISPSMKLTRYLWYAALRPRWSGHADPGRHDPENRWAKAYGTASTESRLMRYRRHLSDLRGWARFVRETLLG
jgi:hypothetical protein